MRFFISMVVSGVSTAPFSPRSHSHDIIIIVNPHARQRRISIAKKLQTALPSFAYSSKVLKPVFRSSLGIEYVIFEK